MHAYYIMYYIYSLPCKIQIYDYIICTIFNYRSISQMYIYIPLVSTLLKELYHVKHDISSALDTLEHDIL